MDRPDTPESLAPHASEFFNRAWDQYTMAELGQWVHLLSTRAMHRTDAAKREKDLYDAQNYLAMMQAKLDYLKSKT